VVIIIAVDPGKMTGVATWDSKTGVFHAEEYSVESFFEWVHTYVHQSVMEHGAENVQIVCESFIITPSTGKNSQAPWSLELIGVCRFLTYRYGMRPMKLQSPAVAKTFATDQKLRAVEWHTKARGHANDAARHLMTYCATNGLAFDTDTLKRLALV
jgi:ABC-type transport system involved in Fe-S cluster assembly fused permease/ATPase subunit